MSELDSLEIRVSASTKKASESIDALIMTLGRLSDAFNVKGIDGFVGSMQNLSQALESINGDNLEKVSGSLKTLSNSAKNLASIGNGAKQAGDGISKLAREIAGDFNITDNGAIAKLSNDIRTLYQSTDRNALSGSIASINELIMKYAQFEKNMGGVNSEVMEFLKNTRIHLDSTWAKELGDDHKWIHTTIGLLNTTREGGLEAADALKKMKELGADVELTPNNDDALRKIAEYIREQKEAQEETVSFNQAVKDGIVTWNALDTALEKIANTVGITTERMVEMATNKPDESTTAGFQQMATVLEHIESIGNPFENVVTGLQELGNIQLSDTLRNIEFVRDAMGKIGGKAGQAAGEALIGIANGMNQLASASIPEFGDDLAVLTQQMRSLGSKTIVNASTSLVGVAEGLNALKGVGSVPQIGGLTELAQSLSVFGRKTAREAVTVIPQLATAFRNLIETLSTAPAVSQNVIDLANAMANLSNNTRAIAPATKRAGHGLNLFTNRAKRATKTSFSLASAIGKVYATYWTLFRVVGMFKKSIDLSSDLTEVQNVVDHVFGSMAQSMDDFAKTAVETTGMSELTAKTIGSRFQSMAKNMGISQAAMRDASEFVQKTTGDYVRATDKVSDMSIALTKLTGDMASFYNQPYEEVAEDMEAIYTGMTRPLRKYGLDLTQATLKEFALANGLNADIKNMTQAEKTLLRYQYVMSHTTAAQGDFERTIGTWANQVRIAQENLKRLQVVIGQIGVYTFKPLVSNFNTAMNDIIRLAESTFNSLGTIFGWQVDISSAGVIDDMADSLEDASDGYDDATKSGKKFKNFLLGIDELNLLPDNSDSGNGSGDGAIAAMASGIEDSAASFRKTEGMFDSIYDTLFKLGKRIGEVQKEWLSGIDWDSVFGKAENFGKGLASFLNGYLSDAELFYQKGRFIANGINTIAHAIYGFFHEFDGYQLGKDLGFELNGLTRNLNWSTIKSAAYEMGHDFSGFFNGVFENVNWSDVGRTIAEGMNTAILFVSTIWNEIHWDIIGQSIGDAINGFFEDFDHEEAARLFKGKIQAILDFANNLLSATDFEMIGEKIGMFLSELQLADYADDIAAMLWNIIKAALNMLPSMFEEAPIETALILGIAGFKLNGFGISLGGTMSSSIMSTFTPKLTALLTTDLNTLTMHGGIKGAAQALGTAIGTYICAAAAAYVGYNIGLEIGKAINPEDEMWYTKDAWIEALKNLGWWGEAINEATHGVEMQKVALESIGPGLQVYAKELAGIKEGMTWEDVAQGIKMGEITYDEEVFDNIKQEMLDLGSSASDVNAIFNNLKSAQDEYTNGFAKWIKGQKELRDEMRLGNVTNEEAYNSYLNMLNVQAEIDRKQQLLANHPSTRYAESAKNIVQSTNRIETAVRHGAMTVEEANKAYEDMGQATVYVREKTEEANEVVTDYTRSLSYGNAALTSSKSNIDNVTRSIGRMRDDLIKSKTGLDSLNNAFDTMGDKKDKTNTLSDTFDNVKIKMNEVSSMFSKEKMGSMLSSIPQAFQIAWSDAILVMKNMWSQMAQWINTNAMIEVPKTKVGNTEIGGQTVRLKVSKFDVGGSIPNSGSIFVANERGPEVVANMGRSTGIMNTDQMEEAIASGMMKALASSNQNVQVILNGDAASFFTAMVKENNSSIMRTGASPLRV